jgi:uncharacterized OsmC-like protein
MSENTKSGRVVWEAKGWRSATGSSGYQVRFDSYQGASASPMELVALASACTTSDVISILQKTAKVSEFEVNIVGTRRRSSQDRDRTGVRGRRAGDRSESSGTRHRIVTDQLLLGE